MPFGAQLFCFLIAGACADITPSVVGALSFTVSVLPSWAYWYLGSAFIYIMLLAGGSADYFTAIGGTFAFDMSSPSRPDWDFGSAII